MVVAVTMIVGLLGELVDDGRLGGIGCKPSVGHRWVEPEDLHSG